MPTCEMNRIEKPTLLDFANEIHCWHDMTIDNGKGGRSWIFLVQSALEMLASEEVLALGMKWYEHPYFAGYTYKEVLERITRESDAFFASLGYEHIPGTGKYKVINHTNRRIALFAHQGFGIAFLSCLLNIPYSVFASHFDIGHSGMTVIDFPNRDGISVPKVMTLASDSHLYREGLPTLYNYDKRF
jgi:probable phosphoglycerate mutase